MQVSPQDEAIHKKFSFDESTKKKEELKENNEVAPPQEQKFPNDKKVRDVSP